MCRGRKIQGLPLACPHLHLSSPFLAPGAGSVGGGAGDGVGRAGPGCPPAEEEETAETEEGEGMALL